MNDTERILEIIKVKNLNNIQFCSITGISPASLSHITSNRSKPTLTILRNVINGFPDINPEWILMGTGPMMRNQDAISETEVTNTHHHEAKMKDAMPSLFDNEENQIDGKSTKKNEEHSWGNSVAQQSATNVDEVIKRTITLMQKPQRKIVEVRIFFDDGTYESFGSMAKA